MKIFTRIVIDLFTDEVTFTESEQYEGPLALAAGGRPMGTTPSPAGQAVKDMWQKGQGDMAARLMSVYANNENDPYRDKAVERMTDSINAQYGARGLATSGIGMKGVSEAIQNFDLGREEQKTNQGIQILQAGSGGVTNKAETTPRGLFGLK